MGWWCFFFGAALVLLFLTLIFATSASLSYVDRGLFGRSSAFCAGVILQRELPVCFVSATMEGASTAETRFLK